MELTVFLLYRYTGEPNVQTISVYKKAEKIGLLGVPASELYRKRTSGECATEIRSLLVSLKIV